jgi:hypothetical protein
MRTAIMTQTSCSRDITDTVSSSLSFLSTGLSTIIDDVDITRRYCYERLLLESYDKLLFTASVNSRDIPSREQRCL